MNYAAAFDKPIRGATVQLLSSTNAVLATTTTDAAGRYALELSTAQSVTVRVRAEMRRSGTGDGDRDVTVLDNTSGNALYALDSPPFTATASTTKNLHATSGWGGMAYTGTRAAGPFAILDVVYDAQAKLASARPNLDLPTLRIYWSVNNRPVYGDPAVGAISGTYFTPTPSRAIYVLGAANTDTDEYDRHTVAHEFGHYVQNVMSRDDSPGGGHGVGAILDPRIAFSEGWGYGWSAIALDDPVVVDTYGTRQRISFSFDVSAPPTGADRGAWSEASAQYLILESSRRYGFPAVYAALARFTASPAFSTLYSYADALKAVASGNATAIDALFASQAIVTRDAFGSGETNDGGISTSLPIYRTWAAGQTFCITNADDIAGDYNRFGESSYVRFTASGSRTLTLQRVSATFTDPVGSNPDLLLLKSDGTTVKVNSTVDNRETLGPIPLPAGTHTIAFTDYGLPNTTQQGVQSSCFALAIN